MASAAAAAMAASNSLYMLQWHEHHTSFFRLMEELCREQSLTDVTITCGDVSLEAHSLILGASSPILRSILAKGEGKCTAKYIYIFYSAISRQCKIFVT